MRVVGVTIFAASIVACSAEPRELFVEVDSDPALVAMLERIEIEIVSDEEVLERFEVSLTGKTPECLPFSFTLILESQELGDPIGVRVLGTPRGGAPIDHRVNTAVEDGLRLFVIAIPPECVEPNADCISIETRNGLPTIDRDEATKRAGRLECHQAFEPLSCHEKGGCYFDRTSMRCEVPCPTATPPMPPEPPNAPMAVAPPRFEPCPAGWTGPTCEPWGGGEYVSACPAGQAHLPSAAGCADIGVACPVGPYASSVPPGDRIHVDPTGAPPPGGGRVVTTIGEALADNAPVILLARGTHSTPGVTVDRAVTIVGACTSDSRVTGAIGVTTSAVVVSGMTTDEIDVRADAALSLSGVDSAAISVAGALDAQGLILRRGGIEATAGGRVAVSRAVLDGPFVEALRGDDARIEVFDVALVGSETAVVLRQSTTASIAASVVRGSTRGIEVHASAALTLNGARLSDLGGIGVRGTDDAQIDVTKTFVENVTDSGFTLTESAKLSLMDVEVRTIAPNGRRGSGINAALGTHVTGERIAVDGGAGLSVDFAGSANVTDLTITNTDATPAATGLVIRDRSTVERVRVDQHPTHAILIREASTSTTTDITIGDGAPQSGVGVDIEAGAVTTLQRVRVFGTRSAGVRIRTAEDLFADVTIEDLDVSDTRRSEGQNDGIALMVGRANQSEDSHEPARVVVRRASFERSQSAGLGVARGMVTATDLTVIATTPSVYNGEEFGGYGVAVTIGSTVQIERTLIADNHDAGIYVGFVANATNLQSEVTARHALITGTRCNEEPGGCRIFRGSGIGVSETGKIRLEQFELRGNQHAGVRRNFVGAGFDLYDGVIKEHPIGIDLLMGEYDLARAIRRVQFIDNLADFNAKSD